MHRALGNARTVHFARLFSKEQNKNRTLFKKISSNLQNPEQSWKRAVDEDHSFFLIIYLHFDEDTRMMAND